MKLQTCLKIALPAVFAVVVAPANALEFYFNAYGGFTDPNDPNQIAAGLPTAGFPAPVTYSDQNTFDTDIIAYHTFGWEGGPTAGSHLTINEQPPVGQEPPSFFDHINDSITESDPFGTVIGTLTHHNLVISTAFGPDYVGIHYHLDIYSDAAKNDLVFESGPQDFTLQVLETVNSPGDGVCRDENGNDTGNSTPCPDRFRFAPGLTTDPDDFGGVFDEIVGSFFYDSDGIGGDERYNVSLTGFWDNGNLVGEYWSLEDGLNTASVRAEIHVPEPGSIALMGIGILGLAFASTRRRRSI